MGDRSTDGDILVVAAVDDESVLLADQLEYPGRQYCGHRDVLTGRLMQWPVRLLTAGVGLVNTAQALTAAIESRRPRLIIQIGSAGVFGQSGLDVGAIGLATCEIDVQLGLETPNAGVADSAAQLPFAVLRTAGRAYTNRFELPAGWVAWAKTTLQSHARFEGVPVADGPFVTVSTVTTTDRRAQALYAEHAGIMENMEGAAAAHLALFYNLALVEVRTASNLVGHRDRRSWRLAEAHRTCCEAVLTLMAAMDRAPF